MRMPALSLRTLINEFASRRGGTDYSCSDGAKKTPGPLKKLYHEVHEGMMISSSLRELRGIIFWGVRVFFWLHRYMNNRSRRGGMQTHL